MAGVKFDQGKAPLSMIPWIALEKEAQVFAYGAQKYGRDNYKEGMDWTRLIDATLRHIYKFADKQSVDDESQLNHLAHARANLAMLLYYMEHNLGNDNR